MKPAGWRRTNRSTVSRTRSTLSTTPRFPTADCGGAIRDHLLSRDGAEGSPIVSHVSFRREDGRPMRGCSSTDLAGPTRSVISDLIQENTFPDVVGL